MLYSSISLLLQRTCMMATFAARKLKLYQHSLPSKSDLSVSLTLHLWTGCVTLWHPQWVLAVVGAACPLGVMMQSNAASEDSR